MKIYIVTWNINDSTLIQEVFSTYEKAIAWIRANSNDENDRNSYDIDVRILDDENPT